MATFDRKVYHFLFLKEEAEETGEYWTVESATALLEKQDLIVIESNEDELTIVLSILPKPAIDKEMRVVALTKTVFLICDDVGFTADDFPVILETVTPPPAVSVVQLVEDLTGKIVDEL